MGLKCWKWELTSPCKWTKEKSMIMTPGPSLQEKEVVGIGMKSPWHTCGIGSISPFGFDNLVWFSSRKSLNFYLITPHDSLRVKNRLILKFTMRYHMVRVILGKEDFAKHIGGSIWSGLFRLNSCICWRKGRERRTVIVVIIFSNISYQATVLG